MFSSSPALNSDHLGKLHNESDTKNKSHNSSNILIHLASGALAGASAKTFIAPLDRTKINFQIKWVKVIEKTCFPCRPLLALQIFITIFSLSLRSKHIKYTFRNALGFIKRTYRKEGFLALYRGNTATLARIIPYSACQFASFEQYRKLLKVDEAKDPHFRRFLAGSLAGITSQSVTYPLDLARARMAITNKCGYKWVEAFKRILMILKQSFWFRWEFWAFCGALDSTSKWKDN